MAFDPLELVFPRPVQWKKDLVSPKNKILKPCRTSFIEDPLRVLEEDAVYSVRFGFILSQPRKKLLMDMQIHGHGEFGFLKEFLKNGKN